MFDSLGHLTYPVRYICGKYGKKLDMTVFSEVIDEILVTLIKNNKALEINTSGCRQKLNATMPDESIVKRYKELGGKLITVGSDAHYAEHLGADIDKAYEIALRCGFTEVAVYQDRTPTLIPIE
jgi:histidinol-phosphatase (PHP family)